MFIYLLIFLQEECDRKMMELETCLTLANIEKQSLLEQKELVVQQLMREKQILQVEPKITIIVVQVLLYNYAVFFLLVFFKESLEEERRMKARAQGEVERCMESWKALEQQWNDERKKFEEEKRQLQDNGSADESRLRRMQEELDAYKTMLDAKEREFVDMQVLEKKIFFQYF